jgi:lysine biosynthesis protein LysW
MGRETGSRLKTRCPECLAAVWLKDSVEQWDPVTCPECHTALEVTSLRPLTLDYMNEWDDDDDDLFDDEDEDWR